MQPVLKRALRGTFNERLIVRLLNFALRKKDGSMWIWTRLLATNLTFFVALQVKKDWDKFVVEIAWSDDGEFPFDIMGKDDPALNRGRTRLGKLWKPLGVEPDWDLDSEHTQAMDAMLHGLAKGMPLKFPLNGDTDVLILRVPVLVDDALNKLQEYGVPLFQRVAETHGVTWTGETA